METIEIFEPTDVRADIFLSEKLGKSRSQIKNMFDDGLITINGKKTKSGTILKQGDKINYTLIDNSLNADGEDIPLDIVYEDQNFAVINKPKGLVVHPAVGNKSGTLVNALVYHFNHLANIDTIRPGIVHRIDKDTAGLLLVAKNDKAHQFLSEQIATKVCKRSYKALLIGNLKDDEGTITTGFGRSKTDRKKMAVLTDGQGKQAITHYKVLERYNGYCLVEFSLQTGRTHQIRVHCAYMHHPIVGDEVYGGKSHLYGGGQLLFAYKLELLKPFDNTVMQFTLDLPDYFQKVLKRLES